MIVLASWLGKPFMLKYDRIDGSEGIDPNKIGSSHECIICHYWYFLRINFRFQPKVCDGNHHMTQNCMIVNDVPFVTLEFLVYE